MDDRLDEDEPAATAAASSRISVAAKAGTVPVQAFRVSAIAHASTRAPPR